MFVLWFVFYYFFNKMWGHRLWYLRHSCQEASPQSSFRLGRWHPTCEGRTKQNQLTRRKRRMLIKPALAKKEGEKKKTPLQPRETYNQGACGDKCVCRHVHIWWLIRQPTVLQYIVHYNMPAGTCKLNDPGSIIHSLSTWFSLSLPPRCVWWGQFILSTRSHI